MTFSSRSASLLATMPSSTWSRRNNRSATPSRRTLIGDPRSAASSSLQRLTSKTTSCDWHKNFEPNFRLHIQWKSERRRRLKVPKQTATLTAGTFTACEVDSYAIPQPVGCFASSCFCPFLCKDTIRGECRLSLFLRLLSGLKAYAALSSDRRASFIPHRSVSVRQSAAQDG